MSQGTGTTRTFSAMLNEYLPNDLLKEEMIKRDYIFNTVTKDGNWKGGNLVVPFKGAGASSVRFGGLTASSDISQSKYVRGNISGYVEVWGSLIFNQRDLMEHGELSEQNFLKLLPDEIDEFMDYLKQVVSVQLGTGPHFAKVTDATNAATGIMLVDHPERFVIDQHVLIDDDDSASLDVYVIAINMNTGGITFSATRAGAAADISAYSVAQNAKFYQDGVTDGAGNFTTFNSLRQILLSNANGGSANVHGVAKTSYPILQAINIDGSDITANNLLDKLFKAYVTVQTKGKGAASDILMSLKHLGTTMLQLELQKGSFVVTQNPKKSLYGWTEMSIAQVATGQELKLVGIQEMDDDVIAFMDWRSVTFRSNGMFQKRKSPEGKEYFEVRNTTGYQYIVDVCLFGEMEYRKPGQSAIVYGISYT